MVSEARPRTGEADCRTQLDVRLCSEPGWQEALHDWRNSSRRIDALRCQVTAVLALSFRNIRHYVGFLEGRAVGRICELPGGKFVAQQSGRNRAAPAYFSSDGCPLA